MIAGDPVAAMALLEQAPSDDVVVFCSVGVETIDSVQRAAAEAAVQLSADVLGIEPLELEWFDAEDVRHAAYAAKYGCRDWEWFPGPPALAGLYVEPFGQLWLRRGVADVATIRAAAREIRWAARDRMSAEVCEHEAEDFAERILALLGQAADTARGARP